MLQAETRKLAAIMFTDIVGFSRQMGTDEARMLRVLDLQPAYPTSCDYSSRPRHQNRR